MKQQAFMRFVGVVDAIIGGVGLGLNGLIASRTVALMMKPLMRANASLAWQDVALNLVRMGLVQLGLGALLLATGIGLLKQSHWARPCAITYGILGMVLWPLLGLPVILGGHTPSPVGYALLRVGWPVSWALANLVVGLRFAGDSSAGSEVPQFDTH